MFTKRAIERANELQGLVKAKQTRKNFNERYHLQRKGQYEANEDFFKPLVDEQKLLRETMSSQQQQQQQIQSTGTPNLPIEFHSNLIESKTLPETWQFVQNTQNGGYFLNGKPITIHNDIIKLTNSNTSYPYTDNMKTLLSGISIDSVDNIDDLKNYLNLTNEAGSSKLASRHQKLLNKIYPRLGTGIIVISSDPKDLWQRLGVIMAAAREGHNNHYEERSAILDKLLQLKEIAMEDYKALL